MGVEIKAVRYKNRFRNEAVNWTLANVGDKITIEIDFMVRTFAVSSVKNPFVYNAKDGYIGQGWIIDKSYRFKDFNIGDTLVFYKRQNGATQTRTIVEKLDDSRIRVDSDISTYSDDSIANNEVISVSTPITAIKYKYNFVENIDSANFYSKIDGTEQRLDIKLIDAASATVLNMEFIGAKSYQIGGATIKGDGIVSNTEVYESHFKIVHNTVVTPYMLAEQWDDLINNVQPIYFNNEKCLKHVFDIVAATDYKNPNWIQMVEFDERKGNTGGYGENFNTGITNYKVTGVTFTSAALVPLQAVELTTNETTFEFSIENTVDAPFSNNNTKIELQFTKAPNDESEYKLNGRNVALNFIDDRVLQTVGSAAANGENFGDTTRQVFKGVTAAFINSTKITITGKVALGVSALNTFFESEEPRYLFNVAVQNHTIETKLADLVRLPVSIKPFYIDNSDPNLIIFSNSFLRHPESDTATEGATTLDMMPEDEVVAYSQFYVDKLGRELSDIRLTNLQFRIKAFNVVDKRQFTLDEFIYSLSGLNFINGNQYVDFSIDRIFQVPETEIRKKVKIKRRTDLDNNSKYYYEVLFPFLSRWEYWEQLKGVSGDFFNITEPNSGFNNEWHHYSLLGNWEIYYEITVTAAKDGVPLLFKEETAITSYDYNSNTDFTPTYIRSYDINTNAELYDAVSNRKFLKADEDTLIVAAFTKVSAPPDLAFTVVNMRIEVFEQGGVGNSFRMSSKWASDGNTWFKSIDLSDKAVLTLQGNTIFATLKVDKDKLPLKNKFKITARLYEPYDGGSNTLTKQTEDLLLKLTEDGNFKKLD